MNEIQKEKLQSLIDYSRFLLCKECCKDNNNCMMLKYNSAINIYELLNSLIKDFTDLDLLFFSKYILNCNEYYSYYLDNIINRSIEIRKIYGKYISKLDVSIYLISFYYMFFYLYFYNLVEDEKDKENVKTFFEFDNISKCINRYGISISTLENIYNDSIIKFKIYPNSLSFGFNDIEAKKIFVESNINWKVK